MEKIKEETSGFSLERLYCEKCGHEPEHVEVLKYGNMSSIAAGGKTASEDVAVIDEVYCLSEINQKCRARYRG